jgi:hypothetical protein
MLVLRILRAADAAGMKSDVTRPVTQYNRPNDRRGARVDARNESVTGTNERSGDCRVDEIARDGGRHMDGSIDRRACVRGKS